PGGGDAVVVGGGGALPDTAAAVDAGGAELDLPSDSAAVVAVDEHVGDAATVFSCGFDGGGVAGAFRVGGDAFFPGFVLVAFGGVAGALGGAVVGDLAASVLEFDVYPRGFAADFDAALAFKHASDRKSTRLNSSHV